MTKQNRPDIIRLDCFTIMLPYIYKDGGNMDKKTKYIFVLSAILSFAVGAWPIGIGITIFGIYLSVSKKNEAKKAENDRLKAENEALKKKLDEVDK